MSAQRSPSLETNAPDAPDAPDAPALARLAAWLKGRRMRPTDFQRALWGAWARGESGLLHAPTGSGKTLALWGGPLLNLLSAGKPPSSLRVLWVTPLRTSAGMHA